LAFRCDVLEAKGCLPCPWARAELHKSGIDERRIGVAQCQTLRAETLLRRSLGRMNCPAPFAARTRPTYFQAIGLTIGQKNKIRKAIIITERQTAAYGTAVVVFSAYRRLHPRDESARRLRNSRMLRPLGMVQAGRVTAYTTQRLSHGTAGSAKSCRGARA
jgi:hypothetical protein